MSDRKTNWWLYGWILFSLALLGGLLFIMLAGEDKTVFLPGETTWGHHQIEMQCSTCHGDNFSEPATFQNACIDCHGAELEEALDSHPKRKFTDPRNADTLKMIDARQCISCHVEHQADMTHPMGVTLPDDYCAWCHQDIGKDRPTHEGMAFDTCASAGCHNFHDNRALYEDFLVMHGTGKVEPGNGRVIRNLGTWLTWKNPPASVTSRTAPDSNPFDHTGHANAGVTCNACHGNDSNWQDSPAVEQCASCHKAESDGFLAGKHGMRIAAGLAPMSPAMAKIPMHEDALHRDLTCNSCHAGHEFDTGFAATEACLGCHADDHSNAFMASPHGETWKGFLDGNVAEKDAVSCATCHMPRLEEGTDEHPRIRVEHNQNATLRPNEKMIRPACLGCHDLQFSLNALADPALIGNNFNGAPAVHVDSVDMAVEREKSRENRKSIY